MNEQDMAIISKNRSDKALVFGYFFVFYVSYVQKMCRRIKAVPVP